jgi:hypothetical protein
MQRFSEKKNRPMERYSPFGALTRLVIAQHGGKFLFIFPNGFPGIRGADTLHAVGSWYNPTTCKVSTENIQFWATFWPSCALQAAWERRK